MHDQEWWTVILINNSSSMKHDLEDTSYGIEEMSWVSDGKLDCHQCQERASGVGNWHISGAMIM
jgi:hypothetical protein